MNAFDTEKKNNPGAVFIGAHPDDPEVAGGGTALRYLESGWRLLFVSMTDGCLGHHELAPEKIRQRRREEAREVESQFGIEYVVLDTPDGSLMPEPRRRETLIRLLRRFEPDIVFSHPLHDYHPDHRYTSQIVGDTAFMLRVPHCCPDTPPLHYDPVQAFYYPSWRLSAIPDDFLVSVSIDAVWEGKMEMLSCHESQFFEWLPWLAGKPLDEIPGKPAARKQWLSAERAPQNQQSANRTRDRLAELYGRDRGDATTYAEVFTASPYPEPLCEKNMRRVFPFLP